jgi:CHAT domain-containing protein
VSDFLEMGAKGVLVGFQAGESRESTAFVNAFYDQLETRPDAAEALSLAWRNWLARGNTSNLGTWAGFQLFIR